MPHMSAERPSPSGGLTDEDLELIRRYLDRPPRERSPDLLCPESEE